jgi:hypothetical protein
MKKVERDPEVIRQNKIKKGILAREMLASGKKWPRVCQVLAHSAVYLRECIAEAEKETH